MSISNVKEMVMNGYGSRHRLIVANMVYRELLDNKATKLIGEWFNESNGYAINNELEVVVELNNGSMIARFFSIFALANSLGIFKCFVPDSMPNGDYNRAYKILEMKGNGAIDSTAFNSSLLTNPYAVFIDKSLYLYNSEYKKLFIKSGIDHCSRSIAFLMYKHGVSFYINGNEFTVVRRSLMDYLFKFVLDNKQYIGSSLRSMYVEADLWSI